MLRKYKGKVVAVLSGAAFLPALAFAQTGGVEFDTTEILGIVTDATAFVVAVGLAVLSLLMIAKGIRWARKAG